MLRQHGVHQLAAPGTCELPNFFHAGCALVLRLGSPETWQAVGGGGGSESAQEKHLSISCIALGYVGGNCTGESEARKHILICKPELDQVGSRLRKLTVLFTPTYLQTLAVLVVVLSPSVYQ